MYKDNTFVLEMKEGAREDCMIYSMYYYPGGGVKRFCRYGLVFK